MLHLKLLLLQSLLDFGLNTKATFIHSPEIEANLSNFLKKF